VEIFLGQKIGAGGGRPAFSQAEFAVRERLTGWVTDWLGVEKDSSKPIKQKEASFIIYFEKGITVEHNPAGILITYEGTDPEKLNVTFGSHIDTIMYEAGREDGQDGIVGAFACLEALVKSEKRPKSNLQISLVTGEESKLVSFAGSIIWARGIKPNELNAKMELGITLKEGIIRWADWAKKTYGVSFDNEALFSRLERPLIGENEWHRRIELHACPDDTLKRLNSPVGITERVMGADARILHVIDKNPLPIILGDLCQPFQITVEGISGHTTSILQLDKKRLFNAWEALSVIVDFLNRLNLNVSKTGWCYIRNVQVVGQALNRVPGKMILEGELHGYSDSCGQINLTILIDKYFSILETFVNDVTNLGRFYCDSMLITVSKNGEICKPEQKDAPQLFPTEVLNFALILGRFMALIRHKNAIRFLSKKGEYFCSLGTFDTVARGIYRLGLDTRSFDNERLDYGISLLTKLIYFMNATNPYIVITLSNPLPGSEPPAIMDKETNEVIAQAAKDVAGLDIPSIDCAAGEDCLVLQKLAKQAMILVRSFGTCHTTSEHVDPEDLVLGIKTQLRTLWILANKM